jgi:predicted anti-sigma-YlaC factor YlaD
MFCSIYKWLISQALDSGKNVSKPVSRHLHNCSSCREFAAFCGELEKKANKEKIDFPQRTEEALNKKIISSLAKETALSKTISRKPILRPILAAASLALIIFSGIFIFNTINKDRSTSSGILFSLSSANVPIDNVLGKIDSPLQEEILSLKETMKTASEFLYACVDPKLGQGTD